MNKYLQIIIDWAEVWALLIPLLVYYVYKPKAAWTKPLKLYLLIALLINFTGNLIWYRLRLGIGDWMYSNFSYFYNNKDEFDNTLLYNLHSLIRFLFFAWFFNYLSKTFKKLNTVIPAMLLLMVFITFTFYKDIRQFSSLLLGTEAALLLVYCLVYYLLLLKDEESSIKKSPQFWTVTGLSIYVVINFPIFLFYNVLSKQAENFAINIWDIHNISYLVLCLFIAKSFYADKQ